MKTAFKGEGVGIGYRYARCAMGLRKKANRIRLMGFICLRCKPFALQSPHSTFSESRAKGLRPRAVLVRGATADPQCPASSIVSNHVLKPWASSLACSV